eukprot:scaffold48926_cov32-Tisochrysis_lutea.AAC.4
MAQWPWASWHGRRARGTCSVRRRSPLPPGTRRTGHPLPFASDSEAARHRAYVGSAASAKWRRQSRRAMPRSYREARSRARAGSARRVR